MTAEDKNKTAFLLAGVIFMCLSILIYGTSQASYYNTDIVIPQLTNISQQLAPIRRLVALHKYAQPTTAYYEKEPSSACEDASVRIDECVQLSRVEQVEPLMFPLQYVSGAPGSGNDWILWVASLSKYTWPRVLQQQDCSYYGRTVNDTDEVRAKVKVTNCLFLKTHEPWGIPTDPNLYAARVVLLLRHPYDAAFSEYKRLLSMSDHIEGRDLKESSASVTLDKFFDISSHTLYKDYLDFLQNFARMWLSHATYWLETFKKPVHVTIYKTVKRSTAKEIEALQRFLGYKFNGVNFRRHCCVMLNPFNPSLKRNSAEPDMYKDLMYKNEKNIYKMMEGAVATVHKLLDKKYPNSNYRIRRG